ncbi:hypothetical protein LX99_02168 [Mucilaginibacter oryzae]|uniref:Uncharacterized protein n=1 Tax=Mucilaginibacter oryzae TaxID=468058 RepID=A0A316HCS3_9SPHI|nr:hypothetical protein [Mucilaginibacter oryzae]PWK78326.1 hypothetical protein LX99_02168 [Mucilaginibacter oryzae]
MNLDQIFPLIVPRSYYHESTWPSPHQQLNNKEFLLTWVFFTGPGQMTYLTKDEFALLNESHKHWQQTAFENLRHSITDNENFFTHQATGSDGKTIKFLVFMHADGIGSSRILLSHELSAIFPDGYRVALPDRSVGMVVPNRINQHDLKEVKQIIKGMHQTATTSMSGQLYDAEWFALPAGWLKPVDDAFSDRLINESRSAIGY